MGTDEFHESTLSVLFHIHWSSIFSRQSSTCCTVFSLSICWTNKLQSYFVYSSVLHSVHMDKIASNSYGQLNKLTHNACIITAEICCFCSVTKSSLTLWDPMECSTLGFPALRYLPELAQTHVHWVSDAIQPPQMMTCNFVSIPDNHLALFPTLPPNFITVLTSSFICVLTFCKWDHTVCDLSLVLNTNHCKDRSQSHLSNASLKDTCFIPIWG